MLKTRAQTDAGKHVLEELQKLAGLLKTETDRRSRQVILAETARMLSELEAELKVSPNGSTDKKAKAS